MVKRIRPKGVIEPQPRGGVHFPKSIRDDLGNKIAYVPNANAVILFPLDIDPDKVLHSLEVLKMDIEGRIEERPDDKSDTN